LSADERAREALHAIPSGIPREEWIKVGTAAIAAGLSLDEVVQWSSTGENFRDERDVRSAFKAIKPNGKIKPATLFYIAKEHGWKNGERAKDLGPKAQRRIVATYDYKDTDGTLISQAVRYEPKGFAQRRPNGTGDWIWNLRDVKVVPYNLPNVRAAIARNETIFVAEGEKDCDNLAKIGVTATCNAGGAGKWRREHSQYLKGAKVVVLSDNDDAGRKHARQVAKSLKSRGCSVSILTIPGLPEKGDVSDWIAQGGTREELTALLEHAAVDAVPDGTENTEEQDGQQHESVQDRTARFPRIWLNDARFDPTCDYFIKGLLERGLIVVYGPSGEGKTFVALDMVCHVAAEMEYRGRRVRRALWVYIAAEAGQSITRRFYAWCQRHLSAPTERIPLAIITRGVNLLNAGEVEELIAELRKIAEEAGMPIGGIAIDTLSRATPGGDENSAEDMTRAVGVADLFRDELGASTLFIHHTGKDASRGARGHSSLRGAADTMLFVADRRIEIEKFRDLGGGQEITFDLEVVDLGTDEDGDAVTTCVVVPSEARPATPKKQPKLPGAAKVALVALEECIAEMGVTLPGTSMIPPNVKVVKLDQWRSRFALRYGDDGDSKGDERTKKAFQRGRECLMAVHAMVISDPYVWLTEKRKSWEYGQ
jgi:hypothetical protein